MMLLDDLSRAIDRAMSARGKI